MAVLAYLLALFMMASPTQQIDKGKLIWQAERSIVYVFHRDVEDGTPYLCTGYVADSARGWVMTAAHCVDKDADMSVDGYPSHIIKQNDTLAIVAIHPMSRPTLELAKDKPEVGSPAIAFGYGYGYMKVMQRNVAGYEGESIVVDGPLAQGMSGGPTINYECKVIGVNQASTPAAGLLSGVKEIEAFMRSK